MKRILLVFVGISFLFSCELENGSLTTISKEITSQYLLNGNLDIYIQNNQIFRYTGKPGIESIPIGNADLSKYEQCFILYVATGTTPETTVSSVIIKLDGLDVLNTSDFSKNMGQYTFEVCNLIQTSVITVEVRGQPGSYVNIWIEGKQKCPCTVTDSDDNIYNTVKIGNQCWMAENLRTTKDRDGSPLINMEDDLTWSDNPEHIPYYCWYLNNDSYKTPYGALYNWYVVETGNLCPTGWHVPTWADWTILAEYLGGWEVAGGKMKEAGLEHWNSPNSGSDGLGADNSSGFTAIPAGSRAGAGMGRFQNIGLDVSYWSSEDNCLPPYSTNTAQYPYMVTAQGNLWPNCWGKQDGFSVRCLKNLNN